MLDYSIIRDHFKNVDTLKTEHQVIAEWNMNKYIPIKEYGVYRGLGNQDYDPNSSSATVLSGDNYLVYDDGTKEVDPSQNYFSQLSSVFKPERPDPGIILLQKFGNMVFAPSASALKTALIGVNNPRYYLTSEDNQYDYFNSAKLMDLDPIPGSITNINRYREARWGISDSRTGKIRHSNPFVVYESASGVFCNKITIKVQDHLAVPHQFRVDTLISGSWQTAYAQSLSSSADWKNGTLNLYYTSSSWSKNESFVDDLSQLTSPSPTQFQKIEGIRLKVGEMTLVRRRPSGQGAFSPASLELIEMSPRLQMDLSDYTELFNFDSSLGDSTSFGLPVGSLVSGTGDIALSNEDQQFNLASELGSLKMLNEDVEFRFYQKVQIDGTGPKYTVPMKVMYSGTWTVSEDYSAYVDLEDGMKFLREKAAPDRLFSSNTPFSTLILLLLDSVGITGLEFKKSSDARRHDKEDTRIRNFFCKKEQTLAEVLEQIAIATQCSMYYDAVGRLNVLTKERLTENARRAQSTSPTDIDLKTDFWFVGNEDYDNSDPEFNQVSNYSANVASIVEEKVNPITDGDIVYHTYGPKKDPMMQTLQSNNDQARLLERLRQDQFPLASLAFSNYGYSSTILWQPPEDNTAVLGAANLNRDLPAKRLRSIFSGTSYTATDEDDLVRELYLLTRPEPEDRNSMVISVDTNEGVTITPFEGIILIDNEYIKYRGKLYYVASTNPLFNGFRIIFSESEFNQLVANIRQGDSISFRGLIVEVRTRLVGKDDGKYRYRVIGDGRGHFGSTVTRHLALAQDSDGIEREKRFKIRLGANKLASSKMSGNLKATTRFNFLDKIKYKSAKKFLGTLPRQALTTYLGFLHIAGPTAPKQETDIVRSIFDPKKSKNVVKRLNEMNKQVDKAVPGNFDNYIYMFGERNIYGQKISLNFSPNAISTRIRLYSPRRTLKGEESIMSTNSSIAGIGFGLNGNNEGYFLEIESAGSGKDFVGQKQAWRNNLRFYKVSLKTIKGGKTVYQPKLLLKASVGAYTVYDTAIQVIKNDNVELDPVAELDILIRRYANGVQYTIFYGDTKIGTYTEPIGEAIGVNSKDIFLFVRNDSQALYEYVMAAARPYGGVVTKNNERSYFKSYKSFNRQLEKGIIPVNKNFVFKDQNKDVKFYFNDFARLAREVKEYEIRFDTPAFTSALLDISDINPKYFVKSYRPTAFGAKLTLVNSSPGAVTLGESDDLPLFIIGIAAQELTTGAVTLKDIYDLTQDDKRRQTDREKNISIYGEQSFNLDSQYIQSISQARGLMRWVSKYCNRQRIKLSLEVFPNPLIELGDKVKVFDKSRGYNESNAEFGPKTFTVSSISHSITAEGPTMTVELIEVGES